MNTNGTEPTPVLSIRDVTRHFGGKRRFLAPKTPVIHAVNGVSLDLARGDSLGVVGESGCGKSTLARMIMGIIPPLIGLNHPGRCGHNRCQRRAATTIVPAATVCISGSHKLPESAQNGAGNP